MTQSALNATVTETSGAAGFNADTADFITRVSSVEEVDLQRVVDNTQRDGFHVIKGLFDETEIRKIVQGIRDGVRLEDDFPSSGATPDQIMHNFQKWSIGMQSPKDSLSRFFRIIYNPLWDADRFGMHKHFRTLIRLRNHLTGMPLEFAQQVEEGGLYSACRLQHYPQGGGFFQSHRDLVAEANLVGSNQTKYIQLLLILTKPGKDFEKGGAYMVTDSGETIFTEQYAEVGDVVVYDGRTMHGVADIDPHKPLDLTTKTGRLAAFTTIYKKWNA